MASPTYEAVILLGRGMPPGEQRRTLTELGVQLMAQGFTTRIELAFAEFTDPSLEVALKKLAAANISTCAIVPVIIPFDRNLRGWITRWLSRWSAEHPNMRVVLTDPVDRVADLIAPVSTALQTAAQRADVSEVFKPLKLTAGASRAPEVARMALVCLGPRCAQAGGYDIYDRVRKRFGPHKPEGTQEDEVMCLKTNCMGPCNFAPFMSVQPDNVWYGGLTLAAADQIADQHLAHGGAAVAPWAVQAGERLRLADGTLAEPDLPLAQATVGAVQINGLFARKAMNYEAALAAFFDLSNLGIVDDELIAVSTPLSSRLAIHDASQHSDEDGHDELQAGAGLPLKVDAGGNVKLQPGKLHLMMLDIIDVPDPGTPIAMSFTFRKAGRLDISCLVHALPMLAIRAPAAT
jgi:copper(I)-binding protein/(2Fe-2S) ferredoxin